MEEIDVNPDKCTSCGNCSKFCPTGAMQVQDNETAIIDSDACVGCGACANVCAEDAITLERRLGKVFKTKNYQLMMIHVLPVVCVKKTAR